MSRTRSGLQAAKRVGEVVLLVVGLAGVISAAASHGWRDRYRGFAKWWWTDHPNRLVLVLVFVLVGVVVYAVAARRIEPKPPSGPALEADRDLLSALLREFPTDGDEMRFLANQAFGAGLYEASLTVNLRAGLSHWDNPEHAFHDGPTEEARRRFVEAMTSFFVEHGQSTFLEGGSGLRGVPPEWEETQPNRWEEVTKRLDRLASEAHQRHQELIRVGKARLGL